MDAVGIKAYGKVNLGLDVTGKRPDGYHLVRMIMQTVDVCDDIQITVQSLSDHSAPVSFFVSVSCDKPEVPTDAGNLAYQAAMQIGEVYGLRGHVRIAITKRIPMAAGMAGGSADGAAVIEGMNRLFDLHMSPEQKDDIALRLGADVPFCLRRGTYLAEGIGERLTKVTNLAPCHMVIVKPQVSVATPWAYRTLDQYLNDPDKKGKVIHPDIDGLMAALQTRNITAISHRMGNILEPMVEEYYPVVRDIKRRLESLGAQKAMMSGSGPTVFGIFTDEAKAAHAMRNLGGGDYGKFEVVFR